jgi:hypothetical protein
MPNVNAERGGRTLAELLVTLTISGVLCSLLAAGFIGHERLVAGSTAIAEMRAHARQAQQILPTLLRAAPAAHVYAVDDTLADFAYPIVSGIVCHAAASNYVILAPDSVASGQHFTSWRHPPRPGDDVHIFDAGALASASDDRWYQASFSGLASVPNGCAGSPLVDPVADAGHRARALALVWSLGSPSVIPAGALVNVTRRTRARLYASSGSDFLGLSDFDPSGPSWSVVQPLSGPYASRPSMPGVTFRAVDSLGLLLPPGVPSGPAALAVHVRVETQGALRLTGMRRGVRSESSAVYVALRNR